MNGLKGPELSITPLDLDETFTGIFGCPFPMRWMRDRYSVMMRSGRSRLDERFDRATTFNHTVGSR